MGLSIRKLMEEPFGLPRGAAELLVEVAQMSACIMAGFAVHLLEEGGVLYRWIRPNMLKWADELKAVNRVLKEKSNHSVSSNWRSRTESESSTKRHGSFRPSSDEEASDDPFPEELHEQGPGSRIRER